ncbi:MAG: thioredoxin [Christensenellales bacterium]
MAKNITIDNIKEAISSNKPVLLDFWAAWCAPCRMLAPSIDQLSQKYEGTAIIGKVNIDEQSALAEQFGVMSIPSVFVIKDGKVIDSTVGLRPKKYYEDILDKAISK